MSEPTRWWLISDEDVEIIKAGLYAPTHEANDFNCQDWPPGEGCRGCKGKELRDRAKYALDIGLHVTNAMPDDWKEEK